MDEVRAKLSEKLGDGPAAELLAAQIAHETREGKNSFGFNVGGIKALDREGVQYQALKTWELVDGKRVDMREPFMSYNSLDEGLDDYLRFLDERGLLEAADTGDVDTFNKALKSAGYYTANQDEYGAALKRARK